MNVIWDRTSIRDYLNVKVDNKYVDKILAAGMQAPSAGDERPWCFIVEDRKEVFDEIMRFHSYSKMLESAAVAIIVCGNLSKEKIKGFWPQDCSACTENMLLEATQVGLGSVWLGVYPNMKRVDGFRKLYDLPDYLIPFSVVVLGYPKIRKEKKDKYDGHMINYRKLGGEWNETQLDYNKSINSKNIVNKLDICIKDLEIFAYHGVHDFEKENGQTFIFSVDMNVDIGDNLITDELKDTVNYGEIIKLIKEITINNKFDLIEFLAQRIANEIIDRYQSVSEVLVEVKKPEAPIAYKFQNVNVKYRAYRKKKYSDGESKEE